VAIKLTSTNLTKQLVRRNKLVHHIDQSLNDWDGPFEFKYESKKTDDAFHPSGDCTPSVQELHARAIHYLAVIDGPTKRPDISPSLRKTFLVGHFWHQFLQHLVVERLGFATDAEIERRGTKIWSYDNLTATKEISVDEASLHPTPFHWATGSADIAPCHVPVYGDCLVDFKTMKGLDFNRNYAPEWCVNKWEAQCNIYMDWFDLEKALIVGIEKDSPHSLKEFEFIRNQPLIDAIYEKWEYVGYFLDNNLTPNADDNILLPFNGVTEA